MSTRELRRAEVLGRVKSKTLRLTDAAKILVLSYRQTKRLWKRYRGDGAKGLQHRSAGRGSNRAKPDEFRRKVVQLIRKKYSGTEQERFGPTLAAEHLADEDGLEVGEETLRRWMLAEGLWSRMRRRKAHRKRRERRQHFGDLVQLDGSFHAWFEERGPQGCLMNMVDDATGTTCSRLGEQETIWAAPLPLPRWFPALPGANTWSPWRHPPYSSDIPEVHVPRTKRENFHPAAPSRQSAAGAPSASGALSFSACGSTTPPLTSNVATSPRPLPAHPLPLNVPLPALAQIASVPSRNTSPG